MAPLFESGQMQVRSLPPQFCPQRQNVRFSGSYIRSIYAPVAQLVEATALKAVVIFVSVRV